MSTKPTNGWVDELDEAKKEFRQAAKANNVEKEAESFLRMIRALNKLRLFSEVEQYLSQNGKHKAKYKRVDASLTPRQKQECELAIDSQLTTPRFQDLLKAVKAGEVNPDLTLSPADGFQNVNLFHRVCMMGDIRVMEKLVAFGTAIDVPFLDKDPNEERIWQPSEKLPSTLTVLGWLCIREPKSE
ncbi:MAG: hypothetical protein SGARI_001138 [Bacillariaceae sp.]